MKGKGGKGEAIQPKPKARKKKQIVKIVKHQDNEIKIKNKGGRPKMEFDLKTVEKLGQLHCTESELGAFFNCSTETISRRMVNEESFEVAYKKGWDMGNVSLRRKQFELAIAGNITMLIWLGKQFLGQKDKMEQTNKNIGLTHLSDDELKKELEELEQA